MRTLPRFVRVTSFSFWGIDIECFSKYQILRFTLHFFCHVCVLFVCSWRVSEPSGTEGPRFDVHRHPLLQWGGAILPLGGQGLLFGRGGTPHLRPVGGRSHPPQEKQCLSPVSYRVNTMLLLLLCRKNGKLPAVFLQSFKNPKEDPDWAKNIADRWRRQRSWRRSFGGVKFRHTCWHHPGDLDWPNWVWEMYQKIVCTVGPNIIGLKNQNSFLITKILYTLNRINNYRPLGFRPIRILRWCIFGTIRRKTAGSFFLSLYSNCSVAIFFSLCLVSLWK